VPLQDLLALGHRDRVDVHIDHSRVRHGRRDLVHVADGGDAGADVEELVHPLVEQVPDRAPQECPVRPGAGHDHGRELDHRLRGRAVGRKLCVPPRK
jgi:hypothetical protein